MSDERQEAAQAQASARRQRARQAPVLKETEKAFQAVVITLAKMYHWRVYHTWLSVRSSPGFPDLICTKPGEPVLYIEVKRDTGELTAAQGAWLAALEQAKGTEVHVWRPRDYDRILQRLQGG